MACACSMPGMMGTSMMDACTCGKGMGCTCGAMGMMSGGMMMGGMMMPKMYMTGDMTCCCCLMMPGCKKEDIQCMMMADGMMMCMGKMSKPEQLKGDGMMEMMKEFGWDMYERKIPCPAMTKMDDCKVMCMDGMCMITMPCSKMLKPE